MHAAVLLTCFLWGIGQNLPSEVLTFGGVGVGDVLFAGTLAFVLMVRTHREEFYQAIADLRAPLLFGLAFVLLEFLSLTVNGVSHGLELNDIVEVARQFYYLILMGFVAFAMRRYGLSVVFAFQVGILVTGVVAYLNPRNEDVFGSVMLWNPNVVGNMLAIGVVLSSILLLGGWIRTASTLMVANLLLAAFSFSKGAWLMCALGLVACYLASTGSLNKRLARQAKLVMGACMLLIAGIAVQYYEAVSLILEFKIETTQFDSSAGEGGTFAARLGFLEASIQMALANPVLGVGISNFETVYQTFERELGPDYWETDNPHSAWLYILACMGFPALIAFILLFAWVFRRLSAAIPLVGWRRRLYVLATGAVFLLSGAVMLQLVTAYFFWFFAGVVAGLGRRATARATRPRRLRHPVPSLAVTSLQSPNAQAHPSH